MIQKILIFNYSGWNQIVASLVEGLKFNKQLELFSTTMANYGQDILIKSEREYSVTKLYNASDGDAPPSLYTASTVIDAPAYIEECQELMNWSDLIIMFDDNGTETSAHFYSFWSGVSGSEQAQAGLIAALHEYALHYYKEKIAMINPGDFSGSNNMYGGYFGAEPSYCKVYFKREKDLDLEWADNVEPIPFSAEERYFAFGKNFEKIWNNKDLNLSCFLDMAVMRMAPSAEKKLKKP